MVPPPFIRRAPPLYPAPKTKGILSQAQITYAPDSVFWLHVSVEGVVSCFWMHKPNLSFPLWPGLMSHKCTQLTDHISCIPCGLLSFQRDVGCHWLCLYVSHPKSCRSWWMFFCLPLSIFFPADDGFSLVMTQVDVVGVVFCV